ncbi:hypothetical protein H0H92_008125 [Tricholoma furcatifolium]|nr:hypothetical protein H0H92_008125 [Tricholoma furcatifolium]
MSQPNRPVVLDDTSSQIQYIGSGWLEDSTGDQDGYGTYGATYNQTLHATQANDSLTLSFEGFNPPWECFIDDVSIGNSPASPYHENNWLLCEGVLSDGSHKLTLNISMNPGQIFWVDYIEYTPTTPIDGSVVLVENTDPALSYDSTWQEVDGLAKMTNTQGGGVSFNFTGIKFTPLTLDYIYLTTSFSAAASSSGNETSPDINTTKSSHHAPGGVIAGAVVGAVVIIVIVIATFLWRKTHGAIKGSAVQPFQASPPESLVPSPPEVHPSDNLIGGMSNIANPISLQSGGYVSGARAQVGDFNKSKGDEPSGLSLDTNALSSIHLHMGSNDEAQPPQYTA